jgi:hypothetical protein
VAPRTLPRASRTDHASRFGRLGLSRFLGQSRLPL